MKNALAKVKNRIRGNTSFLGVMYRPNTIHAYYNIDLPQLSPTTTWAYQYILLTHYRPTTIYTYRNIAQ